MRAGISCWITMWSEITAGSLTLASSPAGTSAREQSAYNFLIIPLLLIEVEHFFHNGPPLARAAGLERLLHGFHDGPPFLSLRIGRHLRHVRIVVRTVVFVISEQVPVFKKDAVIP